MKIHIISTVNGIQNEGMRNVATHISKHFEKDNQVVYSSLRDLIKIPLRCKTSDVTFIFARCVGKVYTIARLCRMFTKNLNICIVQQPDKEFVSKNDRRPLKCDYFTICKEDADVLKLAQGYSVKKFDAGINTTKFCPADDEKRKAVKNKYNISSDKPLVLHVGHCSKGRGLEDFIKIDSDKFEKLIIASGMFENEETVAALSGANVRIISEYIENINELYQAADVYLFPTRSGEFVISVPLSVMEALACGTPAVAYKSFSKMNSIDKISDDAITFIDSDDELNSAIFKAAALKSCKSLLSEPRSWEDVAEQILEQLNLR